MKTSKNVNRLVKISLLVAMAFILMLFEFPIPGFPPFLKLDFSDLPALIGGFALGPVAGVIIEGGKVILNLVFHGSYTGGVGEFANFLVGGSFVFVASYIYHKNKTKKNAIIGLIIGTIVMTIVGALFNYYILIPLYATIMGGMSNVIGFSAEGNSNIGSLVGIIVLGITPFNIIKGAIVSLITFVSYKRISPLISRENILAEQAIKKGA
ncbi:MAG TPA: ECF transporter S component [Clostridium sp.]|uniref:ECF transporter S component n=1 Tax=unclassified Clostridium TaxID=2614128 RepID=UPI000EEEF0AD|nr:ECF transporter S component [Clostridium sp.]